MPIAQELLQALNEMAYYVPGAGQPSTWLVDYDVQTPRGSRTHFNKSGNLNQLPNMAHSETAVLAYLKKKHPGAEVTINDLQWK